jgi:hypothetical protein
LTSLPQGSIVVGCRWAFTLKYNLDGSIARYKARPMTKGFTQTCGVNFFDTFSPVTRLSTLCILMLVAMHMDWLLHQFDVKNAFLYEDLQEVFMQQPPRYKVQGECVQITQGYL